jgi:hypothetical protein
LSLEKDTTTEYERLIRTIVYLDKHDTPYLNTVNQPLFRNMDALRKQYGITAIAEQLNKRINKQTGYDCIQNSFELRSPEFPRIPSATRPEYFTVHYTEAIN